MTDGLADVTEEPTRTGGRVRERVIGISLAVLVFSIGLSGGGYELPANGEVVILISWLLLIGSIMGVLPDSRPRGVRLVAVIALLGLVVLSLASAGWSDAAGRSVAVAVQDAAILSALLLGVLVLREGDRDAALGGLLAGLALVAVAAVGSRFHPDLAPKLSALDTESRMAARLHWPIGYWNTLGFMAAFAVPPALHFAADARTIAARALSAASLPVLALCVLFTISRGSILIAVLGVLVLVVLGPVTLRRWLMFATAIGVCGLLVAAALSRRQLMDALTASGIGRTQAQSVELMTVGAAAVLAAVAGALVLLPQRLSTPSRDPKWLIRIAVVTGVVAVAVGGFLAAGGGPRLDRAWQHFKQPQTQVDSSHANQLERLTTQSSNGRWQVWQGAVEEGDSKPAFGTGAGTFELWWTRNATRHLVVRNAHSQYLEVYAELGFAGVLLLLALVVTMLIGCAAALRRGGAGLGSAAAGTATVVAFLVSSAFDWGWQVTLIPAVAMVAFAATAAPRRDTSDDAEVAPGWRAASGVLAALMLGLAVPPVIATQALTNSQEKAADRDFAGALVQARAAVEWQPYSAAAWLQRGLVYDALGDPAKARKSVLGAIEREPDGWRNWLALAGVEARAGNVKAALAAYRHARNLNPQSPLFATGN